MHAHDRQHAANAAATMDPARVVLHVGGLNYATEKAVVERKLGFDFRFGNSAPTVMHDVMSALAAAVGVGA